MDNDLENVGTDIAHAITQSHVEPGAAGNGSSDNGGALDSTQQNADDAFVDSAGNRFDPGVHRSDAAGTPIKTRTGRFSRIRKPKPALNIPQPPAHAPAADPAVGMASPVPTADYSNVADGLIRTVEGIPVSLLGGHWKLSAAERANFMPHVTKLCEQSDMQDMPPIMAICILSMAYATSRAAMPQTAERIEEIKKSVLTKAVGGAASRVKSWFNFGTKRVRENDASKKSR